MGLFGGTKNSIVKVDRDLMGKVYATMYKMGGHQVDEVDGFRPSPEVLYEDVKGLKIDVVGESKYQDNLKKIRKGEEWSRGILKTEPSNPIDNNAVQVILMSKNYEPLVVGYVPKELAKKLSKQILNFESKGKVIPVLAKLAGGDKNFPEVGVTVWVKSGQIKF